MKGIRRQYVCCCGGGSFLKMTMSIGIIIQLFTSSVVPVTADITEFVVPDEILQGREATMQCSFNDDFSLLINFIWYSSTEDNTDRANADQLLAYVKTDDEWNDFTGGRFAANLDMAEKSSTLTLKSAVLSDDKKYWCFIQVLSGTYERSKVMAVDVLNTSATDLLWYNGQVVQSSLYLDDDDDEHTFECRVIGAKPAPNITWMLDETIISATGQTDKDNNEDARLIDRNSTLLVNGSEFGSVGKDLTCNATVPSYETGVSDTVKITLKEEEITTQSTTQESTTQESTTQESTTQESTTQESTTQESTTQSSNATLPTSKSLKVTWGVNREFNESLSDSSSAEYIKEAEDQTNAMDGVFNSTEDYLGSNVIQFSNGSIVTVFQILLDIESVLDKSDIESTIQTAIDNGDLSSIGVINGSVNVSDLNECEYAELHDCNAENEDCEDTDSGYICKCIAGFTGPDCVKVIGGLTFSQKLGIGLGVAAGVIVICVLIGCYGYVKRKPKPNQVVPADEKMNTGKDSTSVTDSPDDSSKESKVGPDKKNKTAKDSTSVTDSPDDSSKESKDEPDKKNKTDKVPASATDAPHADGDQRA